MAWCSIQIKGFGARLTYGLYISKVWKQRKYIKQQKLKSSICTLYAEAKQQGSSRSTLAVLGLGAGLTLVTLAASWPVAAVLVECGVSRQRLSRSQKNGVPESRERARLRVLGGETQLVAFGPKIWAQ